MVTERAILDGNIITAEAQPRIFHDKICRQDSFLRIDDDTVGLVGLLVARDDRLRVRRTQILIFIQNGLAIDVDSCTVAHSESRSGVKREHIALGNGEFSMEDILGTNGIGQRVAVFLHSIRAGFSQFLQRPDGAVARCRVLLRLYRSGQAKGENT